MILKPDEWSLFPFCRRVFVLENASVFG